MSRKVILVTGSTDGIGKETARRLAEQDHIVWVHGRNRQRAEQCAEELTANTGNSDIRAVHGDFSSLKAVKKMSMDMMRQTEWLDVLINNAGMMTSFREYTIDRYEKTFQVNYLSPFLLTNALLHLLRASQQGRIIHVASMIHAKNIDFDNLTFNNSLDGQEAYSATKLYNIVFSNKLARLLQGSAVTSNSLHPGVINTKLLRQHYGSIGQPVSQGAETSVYLATEPGVARHSGKYFVNSHLATPAKAALDREVQDKLWDRTLPLVSNYLDQ
jgi:NAD(P)-dependent dehydrogenase (short-subunit alcohol dehydrogenase family)